MIPAGQKSDSSLYLILWVDPNCHCLLYLIIYSEEWIISAISIVFRDMKKFKMQDVSYKNMCMNMFKTGQGDASGQYVQCIMVFAYRSLTVDNSQPCEKASLTQLLLV